MGRMYNVLARAIILMAIVFAVGATRASAEPLACDVVTAMECRILTVKNLGAGGTFEVDRSLRIAPSGGLRVDPGGALTLTVDGDITLEPGAKISGEASRPNASGASIDITATGAIALEGNGVLGAVISADQVAGSCAGGSGGTVRITSTWLALGQAITLGPGSRVTANARCSAGAIEIVATAGGVEIRGVVESVSTLSGTGAKQRPGGGPIWISASCDLIVNDTGRVTSRGGDPGADLVHLEAGGDVVVVGLVESTGQGHALPNLPANHCSGTLRPDKPSNSTACIEIWAGKSLVIDGSGSNNGEINADLPQGAVNIAWIDLFALGEISIAGGGAGPYPADASPYAVHANQSVTNSTGGRITVKSVNGRVSLSGQALQADAVKPGGQGGVVIVEAGGSPVTGGNVQLGSSSVRARGSNAGGGPQAGGDIAIRAFNAQILGVAPGELNADGGKGQPNVDAGTVTLAGCDVVSPSVSYQGTTTPLATVLPGACGGKPTLPLYVVFPASACELAPCVEPNCPPPPCEGPDCPCEGDNCPPPPCEGPDCPCEGDNCPPPPCEGPDCPCEGDNCPPPPCEGPECPCEGDNCPPPPCEGSDCPCVGSSCPAPPCEGPECPCEGDNCPPPPPCEGPECPCEGDNCPPPPCEGPHCQPYTYFCPTGSVKDVLNPETGRFPGNVGPDVVVDVRKVSLQAAIDAASDTNNDGYIIVGVVGRSGGLPGGSGRQAVQIRRAYDRPFALIGCGVSLQDPLPCDGLPTVLVHASATSPEHPVGSGVRLYIHGITALRSNSASGWLVQGDGRFLDFIGAQSNMQYGVHMVGNASTIRNSAVTGNIMSGLLVQGDGNTVDGVKATRNYADGITLKGYGNTIANSTGTGNRGRGIVVSGGANLVNGNGAFSNYGGGIAVTGGTPSKPNVVKQNTAGAPRRGNLGTGIEIHGTGQGAAGIVDVLSNTAKSNYGVGIKVTGAGHRLKNNVSGGPGAKNLMCQYHVAPGNFNATGNTGAGQLIPGADGDPFSEGCL